MSWALLVHAAGAVEEVTHAIAAEIEAAPCSWSDEDSLQAHVATVLGPAFEREYSTGADRFDLFAPALGIVVEVKVDGAPAPLLRQLIRYAGRPEVLGIVLVTNRPSLVQAVPPSVAGKPVAVAKTWQWAFRRM